jgi:hypothetical protein
VLTLGTGLWDATLDQLRQCGAGRAECVCYWTGPADAPDRIDALIHPVHTGSGGHYDLDDAWLHRFWVALGAQRRSVRVQVHTHMTTAFHSPTDDTFPIVHTPGFLSLVVPNGAFGRIADDKLWLAEIAPDGAWQRVELADRLVRV